MTTTKRKRIIIFGVVTYYMCCCSYIPQVSADRDAISLNNYFKRIREKREEKKRKKLERQQAEYVNPYDTSIKKKKRSAGDSLLVRSFLLACIFWVIKLSLPHIITWLAELCRDISRFKRSITNKELRRRQKKKKKQAKEKEEANSKRKKKSPPSSSQQDLDSISPSVLSIIEMGNAADDDGSSFISTGTGISTLTSVTEYISSSFGRGRRRQKVTSEKVAHHHSNHKHTTKSSKPSRSSSNHETLDEEKGITKSKLHFIEEDDQGEANGNTTTKKRSSKEKKENLDDVSCLPIVGGNQDEETGKSKHNHRARKK